MELIISHKVKETFKRYIREYSYTVEAGGILIGRIEDGLITIEDLTEPYEKDKCGKNSFRRAEKGHQDYMDRIWSDSGKTITYLGEWHTHDQVIINPSILDYNNWARIISRAHNTDTFVFMILGRTSYSTWIGTDKEIIRIDEVDSI